jgi:predicted RNA-binding Zn-ribbon protein involved in translation (DUF1610 family)
MKAEEINVAEALGLIEDLNMPQAETSNPGPVGKDTGHTFNCPKCGDIRVIAKAGEPRSIAIERVRANHAAHGA